MPMLKFMVRLLPTAALGLCGCDAWPLVDVTGADTQRPRNTYSEHEFAADAKMAAQLDHIVHLHLEPDGAHDGDTAGSSRCQNQALASQPHASTP